VPLFTSGGLGLGLVILVLVLRIWSCLHHCQLVRNRFVVSLCSDGTSIVLIYESVWCALLL